LFSNLELFQNIKQKRGPKHQKKKKQKKKKKKKKAKMGVFIGRGIDQRISLRGEQASKFLIMSEGKRLTLFIEGLVHRGGRKRSG